MAPVAHPNQEMDQIRKRDSFWRRNRWIWWLSGALFTVLTVFTAIVAVLAHRAEPFARALVVQSLSDRFHARVELDSFHLTLGNGLRGEWGVWAEGKGLRIWPPAEVEGVDAPLPPPPVEPFIRLAEFRFHAPLHHVSGEPTHIYRVRLTGLDIHFPPRSHFQHPALLAPKPGAASNHMKFLIDIIDCTNAHLVLGTDKPGKLPLEFAIAHFRLEGVTPGTAMKFEAQLTNPRPPGLINSKGSFGPWDVLDPGATPITGDYQFDHADLSVFRGIAGILDSTGRYQGTLRDLTVDGETNTPQFQLTQFGHTMPLHTVFHARVDGTNGDTWLEPVDATLGRSRFTAQGPIVRVLSSEGGRLHTIGHDIQLNINVSKARIEDFLHLASDAPTPMLTGDIAVKALLHIPPGAVPVRDRLTVKGQFTLADAEFTNNTIQNRIQELSRRGQGLPKDAMQDDDPRVKSSMQAEFDMGGGLFKVPSLAYSVPGADIHVKGTYYMRNSGLEFAGKARMQATVSKMVGGWKGKLLKPADRFFKKDGAGAEIPIYISGTRQKPEFGYNFEQSKSTHPERPDGKQPQ